MHASPGRLLSAPLLVTALSLLTASLAGQNISLPAPRGSEIAITRILAARHDTATFAPDALSRQAVSDLLWISTGINRPSTGGRTTNYSYSSRDNEIYLLCAEGVFVYDQLNHTLTQHSATDLRATLPAPANTAPATFALVTYASDVNFFGAIHTGFISENIALACADRGLGSLASTIIPAGLSNALGLQSGHQLLLLHSVGYPGGTTGVEPAWSVAAGPLPGAAVNDAPALAILKRRRSTRNFASTAFSEQTLADVLWAGLGVNNAASLERTSPQTSGTDAIAIYVLRSAGVHRYRPAAGANHALEPVSTVDLRSSYGYASAPAILIYVADYSKLTGTAADKQRAACLQAGHISQNIATYAAAEGLGELVRSSVYNLADAITLANGQTQLFSQTLGYPASPNGPSTVSFAAGAGGTVSGATSQSIAFGGNASAVTAVPAPGFRFSHWSGLVGGRSLGNPLLLNDVTTAMTVAANFVAEPATYVAWRAANFTSADLSDDSISGPLADPDTSGVTNFQRYAHDLPARSPVANPVVPGTADSGGQRFLTLAFNRRTAATDLTYVVETSPDLTNWTTAATFAPAASTHVLWTDTVPQATASRRFARLRITPP